MFGSMRPAGTRTITQGNTPEYEHVADDRLVGLARHDNAVLGAALDLDSYAAVPHVIASRRGRFQNAVDTAVGAESRLCGCFT